MRTENTIKNSLTSTISSITAMILGLIAQSIFIRLLGAEYLGLNGLFANILTCLSIFELGIGNAIVYHLYKPISENDKEKIKSLMQFYRKAYNIIALLITILGMLLIPVLKYIVGEVTVEINLYIIYILFLFSTLSSYFVAYKRSLLYAYQKNYIINIVHIIYLISLNFLQLLLLFFTKNYYIYLIIKIICQILENIIITVIVNKKYKFITEKKFNKLDKSVEKDIFNKVKALVFHKIGYVIVMGTDNIIISMFIGVISVGYYSNYSTIISAVNSLFATIVSSATASIGNLIITETCKKRYQTFKKLRFLNFWLACFSGVCILTIMQPFIKIWVGEQYLLGITVLFTLVLNYYQKMMRYSYSTFKDAGGIWIEDKYVPLVESLLNIVASIVLLKFFGLAGVFMGTIISGLALWCYSYPKFVYKKLFNRSYIQYTKETLGYIGLFILLAMLTYCISTLFVVSNNYLQVIINTLIALVVPNTILVILFRKTENFKYFLELLSKITKKIKHKVGEV